jgi:hypothetical protein
MRFTPTFGALVALALAGTAQAQPTPPDSPTEPTAPTTTPCDPATDANCAPTESAPLINPNTIDVPPPPPPDPAFGGALQPAPAPYTDADTAFYDRIGLGLQIGGGVDGFTSSALRTTTNDGGSWNVRAILGTRSPLAVEAAYIGSAQSVSALGLDNNALLVSNGVQGDLRLNVLPDLDVQPFVFGGVAWRRYDVTNTRTNTSDVADRDDIVEVPAGVGIAMKRYGFLAEARGEVRAAFGEDLLPSRVPGSSSETMHRWGVNASIGYEF